MSSNTVSVSGALASLKSSVIIFSKVDLSVQHLHSLYPEMRGAK